MTYFALQIIEEANYDISYEELWDTLVVRLETEGYRPGAAGRGQDRRTSGVGCSLEHPT